MKTFALIACLLASASALAFPHPIGFEDVCGPDSNCEFAEMDGRVITRFKPGMGPTSDDYVNRFAKRAEAKVKTKVIMGKTMIDWGCGTVVGNILKRGFNQACSGNGCDAGTAYTDDVKWTNHDIRIQSRKLKLNFEGAYIASKAPAAYRDALMATARGRAVKHDKRQGCIRVRDIQDCTPCNMSRFPNFVHIARYDGQNMRDDVMVDASLETQDQLCLTLDVLGAVAGAVNGVAGGFFGVASAFCN